MPPLSSPRYLDDHEIAARTGTDIRTVRRWRAMKAGPPYTRLGPKLVKYREDQFAQWEQSRTWVPESEPA